MTSPRFKSYRQYVAELVAYATTYTREETRAKLDSLPPSVRRKILEGLPAGAGMMRGRQQ